MKETETLRGSASGEAPARRPWSRPALVLLPRLTELTLQTAPFVGSLSSTGKFVLPDDGSRLA